MALSKVSLKQTVTAAMNFQKFNIADSHFQVPTVVDRCRMMRDRWPPRVEIDGPLFFSETLLAGQASQRRQRASGDPGAEARGAAQQVSSSESALASPTFSVSFFMAWPEISAQDRRRRK